jgi:hypothetical protein
MDLKEVVMTTLIVFGEMVEIHTVEFLNSLMEAISQSALLQMIQNSEKLTF